MGKRVGILLALGLIDRIGRNEQQKGFAKTALGLFWVITGFRTVLVIGAGLCGGFGG